LIFQKGFVQIEHLFISPGHNYFGHHGKPPGEHRIIEVQQVECVAGKGIMDDRFFGFKEDYKGQITFFSYEVYDDLCHQLQVFNKSPAAFRRNAVIRGTDLSKFIGQRFTLQGVEFEGTEECRPCSWMDQAFAPGAETLLKGRGGLRARILTSGTIQLARHDV